ncbi:uncharacterized protein LOC142359734, partial [Opisthocomus hoazin]|uniref:uncharacterized protein LOC142359734 n=1 Tax=Opisthocomus hoazin TaxID=30419 RepID=UPI003F535E5A
RRRNGRPPGWQLPGAAGEEGSVLVARSRPGRQRAPQGLYVSPAAAWWGTAKRPELRKRNGGEQDREASEAARVSRERGERELRCRRAKRLELRKKRGREKGRETSEVSKSPGSTESESCVACTLLLIFGSLCRAARRSGRRRTDCSPLDQRAQLREGVPRCRRGRGSVGGPDPGAERLPGLAGWGTAKRPELRKRNGGEQDREASEAAESPGSAESESCVACTLLLIFGSLCRAARRSGRRRTDCSPLDQRAQLREGVPRCRRGRGSVGGPDPGAERLPGLAGWGTAKRPELRKRNGGEQDGEASEAAESPGSAESESCGAGEPNDWSYGRRREERRREIHLKCQSLPAAPRVRAAWPAPCSSFLAASAEQRVAPGADGRTVRRWSNGRSCGKECRGVGGAEGASGLGALSPGADLFPGLIWYMTE